MAKEEALPRPGLFAHPVVGTTLTVVSGIWFFLLCMTLPLVGKAGAVTPHAKPNHQAFLVVLIINLLLCALAIASKTMRRSIDRSPPAYFSMALAGICLVFLVALLAGWLKI